VAPQVGVGRLAARCLPRPGAAETLQRHQSGGIEVRQQTVNVIICSCHETEYVRGNTGKLELLRTVQGGPTGFAPTVQA